MCKLLQGYYRAVDTFYQILRVGSSDAGGGKLFFFFKQNENGKFTAMDAIDSEYAMKIEYGDFGEADEEIQRRSGEKNYNIKLTISFMGDRGVQEQEERAKEGIIEEEVECVSPFGSLRNFVNS